MDKALRQAGTETVVVDLSMDTGARLDARGRRAIFGGASHPGILEQRAAVALTLAGAAPSRGSSGWPMRGQGRPSDAVLSSSQVVEAVDRYVELPGGDIVLAGLRDLAAGVESAEALLVAAFAPRLGRLGVALPPHAIAEPEHRLYFLLAREQPDSAHGRYNALVRRMVSFARALAAVAHA